jgi:hypothetical protein
MLEMNFKDLEERVLALQVRNTNDMARSSEEPSSGTVSEI